MLNWNDYELITFDCYGTLIDWETGILNALRPVLAAHDVAASDEEILALYSELERTAQSPYRPYQTVLMEIVEQMGKRLGFTPLQAESAVLVNSLGDWLPHPDSVESLRTLKETRALGILSNVDDGLFALSAEQLAVPFTYVVTAQQVRSYKPGHAHFDELLRRTGLPKWKILHVAESLYHDIRPCNDIGIACVWVNRRQGKMAASGDAQAIPDVEVRDLRKLVKLLG